MMLTQYKVNSTDFTVINMNIFRCQMLLTHFNTKRVLVLFILSILVSF